MTREERIAVVSGSLSSLGDEDLRMVEFVVSALPIVGLQARLRAATLRGVESMGDERNNVATTAEESAAAGLFGALRMIARARAIPFPSLGELPGGGPGNAPVLSGESQ